MRSARPDQQGTFQIKGLPAGDYLAVAIGLRRGRRCGTIPEYLESIRRYGQRVRLGRIRNSGRSHLKLRISAVSGVIVVRELDEADLPSAVGIVARGMRDNPLHIAALGSDTEKRVATA